MRRVIDAITAKVLREIGGVEQSRITVSVPISVDGRVNMAAVVAMYEISVVAEYGVTTSSAMTTAVDRAIRWVFTHDELLANQEAAMKTGGLTFSADVEEIVRLTIRICTEFKSPLSWAVKALVSAVAKEVVSN